MTSTDKIIQPSGQPRTVSEYYIREGVENRKIAMKTLFSTLKGVVEKGNTKEEILWMFDAVGKDFQITDGDERLG